MNWRLLFVNKMLLQWNVQAVCTSWQIENGNIGLEVGLQVCGR